MAAQGKKTDARQTNNAIPITENAQTAQISPIPAKINGTNLAILAKRYTENGTENPLSATKGIGAGYEFLLGLAVENIGLGIDVGIRTDLITTSGQYANNSYALFAFGSTAGVLQLQYVF